MLSVKLFEVPEGLGPKDVARVLEPLPEWRLRRALSYRFDIDRFLCARSFLLLEEMLRENFGIDSIPEFSYGEHGKPYIGEQPGIFFNISHCRKAVACAVSDRPVGIDIEAVQYDADLCEMVLNPREKEAVGMSAEPSVCFSELWTRKESLLKLTGEGVRDDMKDVLDNVEDVAFTTEHNRSKAYVFTVSQFITR